MEITREKMLEGRMTEAEISETYARLEKIGAEGSAARNSIFDLDTLARIIKDAIVPNQITCYETAHYEQALLKIRQIRDCYRFSNRRIESGLNWMKQNGLLDANYWIPSIAAVIERAETLIRVRNAINQPKTRAG
jgi:hypothetical protein